MYILEYQKCSLGDHGFFYIMNSFKCVPSLSPLASMEQVGCSFHTQALQILKTVIMFPGKLSPLPAKQPHSLTCSSGDPLLLVALP